MPENYHEPISLNSADVISNAVMTEGTVTAETNRLVSPFDGFSNVEHAKPINRILFPNPPLPGSNQLPATIDNTLVLISKNGIGVRYNLIKKKLQITIPHESGAADNFDNNALAHIYSLANQNGIAVGQIPAFLEVIGNRNPFNPILNWVKSKDWDGVDRLPALYATLVTKAEFPKALKETLMYRWMLSAVAAAIMPSGFKARGVLTLQGTQSIGKTSWISALIPDAILREAVLKLDHHLDAGNKDSIITAVSHWIVEIGELDSSFKKDIARLKGFLTADRDKLRRPYDRADSEYQRRTVFCATVNEHDFLVDPTGNSRWWTIPVTSINYKHGIDMQQLYAQLAIDFAKGEQWWLTQAEEQSLELHNKQHRSISAIRDRLLAIIDIESPLGSQAKAFTPTQLLQSIDIKNPTNMQSKECAAVLREFYGEPKRIQGYNKWRVNLKPNVSYGSSLQPHKDSEDEDAGY